MHVTKYNPLLHVAVVLVLCGVLSAEAHGAPGKTCEQLFQSVSQLDFESRSDLETVSMNPSLIQVQPVRMDRMFNFDLSEIRRKIESLAVPDSMMESVVYPMSGYDLTTPLQLFPEARNYILIDTHSLLRPHEMRAFTRRRHRPGGYDSNSRWIRYDETSADVFQKLLTSLFAVVPSAKVRSVKLIADDRGNVSLKLVFSDPVSRRQKTVYYLVGEIGHMNSQSRESGYRSRATGMMEAPYNEGVNWWDGMLAKIGPRVILVKGSMSALRQTRYDQLLEGRERLLAPLLKSGGLVVEGASHMSAATDAAWAQASLPQSRERWELTDGDPRLANPTASRQLFGMRFSYSGIVNISVFEKEAGTP